MSSGQRQACLEEAGREEAGIEEEAGLEEAEDEPSTSLTVFSMTTSSSPTGICNPGRLYVLYVSYFVFVPPCRLRAS
jgi:hypothetical protein